MEEEAGEMTHAVRAPRKRVRIGGGVVLKRLSPLGLVGDQKEIMYLHTGTALRENRKWHKTEVGVGMTEAAQAAGGKNGVDPIGNGTAPCTPVLGQRTDPPPQDTTGGEMKRDGT